MVRDEMPQKVTVDLLVKDALDHGVQATVQRVSSGQVEIARCRRARIVPNVQDLSSQLIMSDDRHASRTRCPDGGCQC
jgi:hypothetical protein